MRFHCHLNDQLYQITYLSLSPGGHIIFGPLARHDQVDEEFVRWTCVLSQSPAPFVTVCDCHRQPDAGDFSYRDGNILTWMI